MAGQAAKQALIEVCKVNPPDDFGAAIRVLVVNESGFIREGLCQVIDRFEGVNVVGCTHYTPDLEEVAQRLRVNVALIDSQHFHHVGFHAARQLFENRDETRVVFLSVNPRLTDVKGAMQSGASGFLLREAGVRDLQAALHAAAQGEVFLCPTLLKRLSKEQGSENTLEGINVGTSYHQNRYSIDEMLLQAQHLGILQQDE
ncbi:response regulator [Halomonas janggokensis]|uniref:Response regulator n=1 Tax=Vreelandella janggokensis TaxID=370767 RepID=A0ABT4IQD5_9GAMM|nr:response regulator [Halomonas janggokensis]MCZ0925869.1 response regulator [Halomonas janggokensis]MCZ0930936.1 response regulator [Halomonas janggokensis]